MGENLSVCHVWKTPEAHHFMKRKWIDVLTIVIPVLADQFTKYLAIMHLKDHEPLVLLPGILELRYLENRGAAFSMLQNQYWFFYILTVVFLTGAVFVLRKMPGNRRMLPLRITVLILMAGAIGNFIDRLLRKYVVDFIYFSLIDFPIFNAADICVTLSVVSLLILILFYYKDKDLAFLGKDGREADGRS